MHSVSLVTAVVYLTFLILIVWQIYPEVRYVVRRYRSKNWPTTTGTIDRGVVASTSSTNFAIHFTYSYSVGGLYHSGRFFLFAESNRMAEELRQKLVGRNVPLRYDDRKPGVALLMDEKLEGKTVKQYPVWTFPRAKVRWLPD